MEINTIALRELIVEQLNESEFSTICFDLNETYPELKFDFDKDIAGHLNFSSKVMETIKYMRRRTALEKLVAQIHKAWPDIDLTPVGYKPTPAPLPVIPTPIPHNEQETMDETWINIRKLLRNPNYYTPDDVRNQVIPYLGYNPAALAGPEASLDLLINKFVDQVRADGKLTRLVTEMKTKIPHIETLLGVQASPQPAQPHNPNPPVEQPAVNNPQPTQPSNPVKPATEYVDFDIRISEPTDKGYMLEASYYMNGRAGTDPIYQPFHLDDPEFKNLRTFLEELVAEESDAEQFGKQLGKWLFAPDIAILYGRLQGRLNNTKGVRIRLEIRPPELSSLPWEYCYDEIKRDYLAKDRLTPIVRYIDRMYTPDLLEAPRPLKILMVLASPKNLPALDASKELEIMQKAISSLGNEVQLEVVQGSTASISAVHDKIQDFQPHVLHFVGHGQFDGEKGAIFLVDEEGNNEAWYDYKLASTLRNSSVKLVVLNACQTAKSSDQRALVGVAPRLVTADIPAVIAMQFAVPDKVALKYTEALYKNLARGQALDEAITQMRIAVHNLSDPALSVLWAVPVLFMRSPDGRLWGTPSSTTNPAGANNLSPSEKPTSSTPTPVVNVANQKNVSNIMGGVNMNIGGNTTARNVVVGNLNIEGGSSEVAHNYAPGTEPVKKEPTLAERIQKISQDLTQKASQLPADQLQEAQGYLKDAEEKAQAPAPSSALIKFRLEKTLEIVLVHLNGDPNLVGQLDSAITLSKKI